MNKEGQNVWGKLKRARVSEKTIFILLLAGIVAVLIPMLVIARYNVPCADDYSYGGLTHSAWKQSHSLLDVLDKGAQTVNLNYSGWQGTYSAVFAFSLQPAVFGEQWYPLTTYIMLISLCGGIAYLLDVVFRRILNATRYQTGIVIIAVSAVCTQLLPSPVQAFYWFNGSAYYTFFFGISLVLYAKILTYIRLPAAELSPVKRALRLLSLSVLSAIIAGTNYVTALTTAVVYACVLLLMLIRKKYSCLSLMVPFCVFIVGFIVSVTAPGNSVRQAAYQDRPSALASIFLSFGAAVKYAWRWLTPALILLLIFLAPLLYKITARTSYSYSYPLLVLAGSFCLFASMFCPSIYAMGNAGPARLLNIIYFAAVILLVFDLSYLLGWCRRTAEKRGLCKKAETREDKGGRPVYPVVFLLALSVLFLVGSKLDSSQYTSSGALQELLQGEASAYYDTAMERLELLQDDSLQDVVLPRFPAKPRLLYFDDVTTDPADWRNVAASNYYHKNSVILAPEG